MIQSSWRRNAAYLCGVLLVSQGVLPVLAQTAVSGDLNSTLHTVAAPNQHPVAINIGGMRHVVQPGQLLTPAEAFAVTQLLATGHTTLQLGANGAAIGGTLLLPSGTNLSSLAIPKSVTTLASFNNSSPLGVMGNLTNAGNLYAFTNNASINTATIAATNIFNYNGALISSVVPSSLSNITGRTLPVALGLTASNSIVNSGAITGATSVNLQSPNITNNGTVTALNGNVNVSSPSALAFNNTNGTVQAVQGDINVRTSGDFNLTGGDVLSNKLNINVGCNTANVNSNNVTGEVNLTAAVAHVNTASPEGLHLGNMNITGDPTFFNAAGDVSVSSLGTNGADLAIIASGNITGNGGNAVTLNTQAGSAGNDSGSVTMIAGARFLPTTIVGSSAANNGVYSGPDLSASNPLTILGPSATGGSIQFGSLTINTSGFGDTNTSVSANGGNITMVAFAGSAPASGHVTMNAQSNLITGGDAGGTTNGISNGNILILAGAHRDISATAGSIQIGRINTQSVNSSQASSDTAGAVLIRTSTPLIDDSGPMQITGTGTLSGSFLAGQTQHASVDFLTPNSASPISTEDVVTVVAGNNVRLGNDIVTRNRDIAIFAGHNITSQSAITLATTGVAPNGASSHDLILAAGVNVVAALGNALNVVQIAGSSPTGGSVNMLNASLIDVATSGGSSQPGGNVQIVAAAGADTGSGTINLANANIITGGDPLAGGAGNVSLFAGKTNNGAGIILGAVDTTNPGGVHMHSGNVNLVAGKTDLSFLSYAPYSQGITFGVPNTLSNGIVSVLNTINMSGGDLYVASNSDVNLNGKVSNIGTGGFGGFPPNSVTIKAGGDVGLPASSGTPSIDVGADSDSSGAGIIFIEAGAVLPNQSGSWLSASGGQVAGSITVVTHADSSNIPLGLSGTALRLSTVPAATSTIGFVAGTIEIDSAGPITGDAAAIEAKAPSLSGARGAGVTMNAPTFGLTNVLDTSGPGGRGDISVTSNSASPLTIGNAAQGNPNFIAGTSQTGTGGGNPSLTIQNNGKGGISLIPDANGNNPIDAGARGSVFLIAPAGLITTTDITGAASLQARSGKVTLTALGYNIVHSEFAIIVDDEGDGIGQIHINSTGTAKPVPNGGTITLGSSPGMFDLFAQGSGGNSTGVVSVSSAANIIVDTAALKVSNKNGNGASLTFTAGNGGGKGTVSFNTDLDLSAPGKTGGSLQITENSAAPFTINGGTTSNGINGKIDISGDRTGILSITNAGGGITSVGTGIVLRGASTATAGGSLVLVAQKGNISVGSDIQMISSNATGDIAASVNLSAPKGTVFVNGNIDLSTSGTPLVGPQIQLTSGSSKTFTVTAPNATTNGVTGTINASSGGGSPGSITITNNAAGGIAITSPSNVNMTVATGDGSGGSIQLSAPNGGNIVVRGGGLSADAAGPTGGTGGSISLSAPKGNVFVEGFLSANGAGQGASFNGGTIKIDTGSAAPFNIGGASATDKVLNGIVGGAPGQPSISAAAPQHGNDGGTISVTNNGAGGIIVFSTNSHFEQLAVESGADTGTTLHGGHVSVFAANGPLVVDCGISVYAPNGQGELNLVSNSAKPFFIGPNKVNGVDAPIANGGDVLLEAESGSLSIQNLGAGGVVIADATNLNVGGTVNGAAAGTIMIQAPKGAIGWQPVNGIGGNPLSTNYTTSSGIQAAGGTIRLLAQSYNIIKGGTFDIQANSIVSTVNPGEVDIYSTGSGKTLAFGTNPGEFNVSATGGSNSGTFHAQSAGDIIVDQQPSLSTSNANGPTIILNAGTAGSGNVIINTSLDVSPSGAFNGGLIDITSNSAKPFIAGGTAPLTNGVTGTLTAAGGGTDTFAGIISIRNLGTGGIAIPDAANELKLNNSTSGGVLTLVAAKGNITFGGAGPINLQVNGDTNATSASPSGGRVSMAAQQFLMPGVGAHLVIDTTPAAGPNQSPGLVTVNLLSNKTLALGTDAGGINFTSTPSGVVAFDNTFTSAGNILIQDGGGTPFANQNESVALVVSGKGTITGQTASSNIAANSLTLKAGAGNIGTSADTPLLTGANNLTIQTGTGNVFVSSSGGNGSTPVNVGVDASTRGLKGKLPTINIQTTFGMDVNHINAEGDNVELGNGFGGGSGMVINGDIVASNVTLTGNVQGGGNGTISAQQLTLQTPLTAGSFVAPIKTDIAVLRASGGGASIGVSNNGSLTINQLDGITNVSIFASGTITVNAVAAGGGGFNLQTLPQTDGTPSNGSIILNKTVGHFDTVNIALNGSGSLYQAPTTTISGLHFFLTSDSGNINAHIDGAGDPNAYLIIEDASTGGAGKINLNCSNCYGLSLRNFVAGGNSSVITDGFLEVSTNQLNDPAIATTQSGSLTLHSTLKNSAGTPAFLAYAGTTIFAGGGDLTIQSDDTTTGSFRFSPGATIGANGHVVITDGTVVETAGTQPGSDWATNGNPGVNLFYGTAGSISTASPTNGAVVNGDGKIVFNATGSGNIDLQGGVNFISNNAIASLATLDLTKAGTNTALNNAGIDTTGLKFSSTGAVTGGTVTIDGAINLANLQGLNIPAKTTVQILGADLSRPMGVDITSGKTSALVNGTLQFVGDASTNTTATESNPVLSITSTIPGQVLTVAKTGTISSDASLSVLSGGSTTIAGNVTAPSFVAVEAGAGPNAAGKAVSGLVTITGNVTSAFDLFLNNALVLISGPSGYIQTAGSVKGNDVNLYFSGANSVTQSGGLIQADSFRYTGGSLATTFGAKANSFNVNFIASGETSAGNLSSTTISGASQLVVGELGSGGTLNITAPTLILAQGMTTHANDDAKLTATTLVLNEGVFTANPGTTLTVKALKTDLAIFGDGSSSNLQNLVISAPGSVNINTLNTAFNVQPGTISISAKTLNILSTQFTGNTVTMNVGQNLTIDNGNVQSLRDTKLAAGGALAIRDSSQVSSGGNLTLIGGSGIQISSTFSNPIVHSIGYTELLAGTKTSTAAKAALALPGTLPLPGTHALTAFGGGIGNAQSAIVFNGVPNSVSMSGSTLFAGPTPIVINTAGKATIQAFNVQFGTGMSAEEVVDDGEPVVDTDEDR